MSDRKSLRWVLDIAHPAVLGGESLKELTGRFMHEWRIEDLPAAVCLPAFTQQGPWFENRFGVRPHQAARGTLISNAAREAAALPTEVVLVVDPTVKWLAENLELVDIRGNKSAQPCIFKTETRKLLAGLVGECLDQIGSHVAAGQTHVAFDGVDLWPMGAEAQRIMLTCFCGQCSARLLQEGVNIPEFKRVPNAWNLALADSGTGISFVDRFTGVFGDVSATHILDAAKLKGFDQPFAQAPQAALHAYATLLLQYMDARHRMTVEAAKEVFDTLASAGSFSGKRIFISECMEYDWTGGTFLAKLDAPSICDELWYDYDQPFFMPSQVSTRIYLAKRSRYTVDAFWSLVEYVKDSRMTATTGLARERDFRGLLEGRARTALGALASPGPLSLLSLPLSHERVSGFVVPALTSEVARAAVDEALAGSPPPRGG